jgi:hypothetical protein
MKKPATGNGAGLKKLKEIVDLVPLVGFELTTYRLQGGCSTN